MNHPRANHNHESHMATDLRFIPFRLTDIVRMCRQPHAEDDLLDRQFCAAQGLIERHFREDFYRLRMQLKEAYAPLDPDTDTRKVEFTAPQPEAETDLAAIVEQVLQRANYEHISPPAMQKALQTQSLFRVQLYVDFSDFDEVLLYYRGATRQEEELRSWFGLKKTLVQFTNLERVVLYIRFKDKIDVESTLGGCRPNSTMLKLFQNVPDADIEMLFPNTRVGMRLIDKLMIGVPALISGGIVFSTKLGTMLVLLGSLLGYWLGVHSDPIELNRATGLVLLAGFGALIGYLWKQFSSFRNRKLKYTQALTRNLYFKLLDNNAGVFYRILDEAEESECKESLVAYGMLLRAAAPLTASELDRRIESWFAQCWQCQLNFEVQDALDKLQTLGLARRDGDHWVAQKVVPPEY